MHETKKELIERNGLRCMLCGKIVPYKLIEWHHIIPKHITKFFGLPQDDSYENGSLLCVNCHKYVHEFEWGDKEYEALMDIVRANKKPR